MSKFSSVSPHIETKNLRFPMHASCLLSRLPMFSKYPTKWIKSTKVVHSFIHSRLYIVPQELKIEFVWKRQANKGCRQ